MYAAVIYEILFLSFIRKQRKVEEIQSDIEEGTVSNQWRIKQPEIFSFISEYRYIII